MNAPRHSHTLLTALTAAQKSLFAVKRHSPAARRIAAQRSSFYDKVWREAAEIVDAQVQSLPDGSLEIRWPGFATRVESNQTQADDQDTLRRAADKPLVSATLSKHGLRVPRWRNFTLSSLAEAAVFMRQLGGNFVVKPAFGTGAGAGITTNVRHPHQLLWAAANAAVYGRQICIEEQIEGDNYRLLYLDGVLLDAVMRRPPSVTGDGRASVRTLIRRANQSRVAHGALVAQTLIHRDLDMRYTLASQGLKLATIPAAGRQIRLKTVINDNGADDNAEATHLCCTAVIEAGARAARAVGVRLAGIDIITTDPSRPLNETGGVILEVNTTPGLYYHYHRIGKRNRVAVDILNYLHLCGAVNTSPPLELASAAV